MAWHAQIGSEISVTDRIFGRWEFAVADYVYIRNGSRRNIDLQGAQTYNSNQYLTKCCL